jgi:prophage regulatory protein
MKIHRLKGVTSMVGLSRSSIYALMKADKFPKSIPLGERSIGWLESDIQGWIDSRVTASNAV